MPGLHSTKIALTMRLTVFLMLVATLKVSASAFAQSVTMSVKNAPMEEVFSAVKEQTGYLFFYDKDLLRHAKPVTVKAENTALVPFLTTVFKDRSLDFTIRDKTIFIRKKELPATPQINGTETATPQQEQRQTGQVKDVQGQPLIGVSIKIQGTSNGVVTNENGYFSIPAKEGDVMVFSYIGYESKTQPVALNRQLLIILKAQTASLDEAVVIGYGTTSKRYNTGSVSSIKASDIANQPVLDALGALQGRVSGVFINSSSGLPGSNFSVVLRGQSSLSGPNNPLYVIDGVPFYSEPLNTFTSANGNQSPMASINPADIERIDVLKDADATSIYGSRGGNGVILITTKKGKAGKTQTNFNVYTGAGKVVNTMDMLSTPDYVAMRKEAYAHDNKSYDRETAPDITIWDQQKTTDWQKFIMGNTARITEAQGTVSGGTAQTQYLISGTYHKETTVMPGSLGYQRGAGRMNINHTSLNGKFNINASVNYTANKDNSIPTDLTLFYNLAPNFPLYDSTGALYWTGNIQNPQAYLLRKSVVSTNMFLANTVLRYTILPGLNAKASLGYTHTGMDQMRITPNASLNPLTSTGSESYFGNSSLGSYIIEPQLDYNKDIAKGNLQVMVGGTFQQNITNGKSVIASGFSSDALLEDQHAAALVVPRPSVYAFYRYTSIFGRVNYNWDGKYIVNASFRRDGSTRFGPGNRFGNFGAVGAAWVFSKESFIGEDGFLSFGKLRGSIGSSGNDNISDYQYLDAWSSTPYPYGSIPGLTPSRLPNNNYRWETNHKKEIGLELGFLDNRIMFNTNYYYNISDNQLVAYQLTPQVGFESITANLPASVMNSGWEVELNTTNIKNKHFSWQTGLNMSINKNKLKSFPGIESSTYKNIYVVGEPLSIVKGYQFLGIDPATGTPKFFSNTGAPTPTENDDYVILGKRAPDFYGGFSNTFNWKGFTLDVLLSFVKQEGPGINYGYSTVVIGGPVNQDLRALDRWHKPGDITSVPGATTVDGSSAYRNYSLSTANWGDASYIRLKNVSLRYDLSKYTSKWKLSNLSVYALGQNLFTITNYKGLDPETQGMVVPPLKSYTIGVQFGF
ncbi:TonB-linked outer membrane protein, SusC/RagA family [Chitinophaga jiangningensis]|uniref:TonB-linked outer membrane protein, SusC/RagA family n=2 Tax=Chitinophaga jiangningensis TaxID=1419482 RepID=A0A1M6VMY9_9BACT|nr:TonB-linked outer membrane protein, SusC/RagA family [Chitinophaga jiangningensis]